LQISDKRKSGGGTTHKKKNFKKTAGQRRVARKNMSNGTDLISKIYAMMEKHKEVRHLHFFFVFDDRDIHLGILVFLCCSST
jgi:hypothetical protein